MTKKEFKEAMLRGLGRCVIAVQNEPEKYRDMVLLACKQDIAYDAQSEGTRAWYVYALASAYPDPETFIGAAAEALKKHRSNGSWNFLHLCELLMLFAMDGSETAKQVLEEKYQELLDGMLARKRRPDRMFHELSDLEQLGLVLAADKSSFIRIARDFGRLYLEKAHMEDGDFAWFFSAKGGQYRKTMERTAETDEYIACFLQREQASIAARDELWNQQKDTLIGIHLSRWLSKQADQETIEQYAAAYREQTQPEQRAEALMAFACCPYPDDPQPILADTQSDCEELHHAAWRALERIRHVDVRQFALDNAEHGVRAPENFALLATNYVPKDGPLLESLLREQIASKDWDGVHATGLDIYRIFDEHIGKSRPKHLLPLLYEYNPCSFCRKSALEFMAKHRMLTKEILEECQFDSNDEIRQFAAKHWKSFNTPRHNVMR